MELAAKLEILANAAKYDAPCAGKGAVQKALANSAEVGRVLQRKNIPLCGGTSSGKATLAKCLNGIHSK
jgi:DNA replication protein DnaC